MASGVAPFSIMRGRGVNWCFISPVQRHFAYRIIWTRGIMIRPVVEVGPHVHICKLGELWIKIITKFKMECIDPN